MITLVVPTKNRSHFVARLLRYYRDVGFAGRICIGDSSEGAHVARIQEAVGAFQDNLNIAYREYPNLNHQQCVQQLLDFVATRYAALAPDDDFLVPSGLERCAEFLEKHPEYSAAHGMGVLVRLQSSGAYGRVGWTSNYRQPVIEGQSACARLREHLGRYSVVLFSVHRLEVWRLMYRDVSLAADNAFAGELLPCCLSVILGKVKELDCLYVVRQDHGERYLLPTTFDWITNAEWQRSYEIFREALAAALARQDGVTMDEARATVREAFWSYLARCLMDEWPGRRSAGVRGVLRRVAEAVPGAYRMWGLWRSTRSQWLDEFSLRALRRRSSRYHDDFAPISRALSAPPVCD